MAEDGADVCAAAGLRKIRNPKSEIQKIKKCKQSRWAEILQPVDGKEESTGFRMTQQAVLIV
jgi:hypothetical protein